MAPVKGKGKSKLPSKRNLVPGVKPSSSSSSTKKRGKGPPPVEQKTKSAKSLTLKKVRKKEYTAEQLGVPKLNTITPVGVQKPRGKKKGKVFVDDPHTMQTILSIVNAETEGKIESKMLRARQMEEIREARQKESEAKEESRRAIIENKKEEIRKGRKKGTTNPSNPENTDHDQFKKKVKKVSFG